MRLARSGALPLRPRHGRRGEQRADLRHAQLHRLADGEFHALARGNALHQGHAQRRLALDRVVGEDIGRDAQLYHRGDAPRMLAAAPVEQRDGVPGAQTQYVDGVVRGVLGQEAGAACAQRRIDVEAGRARQRQ